MTPKQEAEDLMNEMLPVAKRMLREHGEFFPLWWLHEAGR
jgi:hypothetical protein